MESMKWLLSSWAGAATAAGLTEASYQKSKELENIWKFKISLGAKIKNKTHERQLICHKKITIIMFF